MILRRSRKNLEEAIIQAKSKREKALAYYELGLFHDNNAREIDAIPYYIKALALGLDSETKAKASAWLASSLYKTNNLKEGVRKCREALRATKDEKVRKFLVRLEKRIRKRNNEL